MFNSKEKDLFRHYNRDEKTSYSAKVITKLLIDIVNPSSVVDVGCGVGTFLKAFKQHGINNVLGLDSQKYVDLEYLKVNGNEFVNTNLEEPFKLRKKYDLAITLEVAEHLNPKVANDFVTSLTRTSDVVCFSAAIPGQGGKGHVNEQWQEYWIELFEEHNYDMIDCIRPQIWYDQQVIDWYKMNTVLFVKSNTNAHKDIISQDLKYGQIPSVVHPERFKKVVNQLKKEKRRIFPRIKNIFK